VCRNRCSKLEGECCGPKQWKHFIYTLVQKCFDNELEPFKGVPSNSKAAELWLKKLTYARETSEGNSWQLPCIPRNASRGSTWWLACEVQIKDGISFWTSLFQVTGGCAACKCYSVGRWLIHHLASIHRHIYLLMGIAGIKKYGPCLTENMLHFHSKDLFWMLFREIIVVVFSV
jgi:hypothetical protein